MCEQDLSVKAVQSACTPDLWFLHEPTNRPKQWRLLLTVFNS